jgi:hypothetical protein
VGTLKVDLIVLIVLRQAIKLEILGMKHSSGKTACKRAKDIIGLPKGTSKQKTLEVLEQIINDEKKMLNENSTSEHP